MLTSVGVAGEAPFTEESAARGLVYPVDEQFVPPWTFGRGVGLIDLDGDGDPDVVALGRTDGRIGIFENDGTGHFTDRSDAVGIPTYAACSGVSAADYDADGDLDVYVSRWGEDDVLLRNEGGFTFTDVTAAAGLDGFAGAGTGCAWADVNGDGWLDLAVANRSEGGVPEPDRLFLNDQDGTFTEVGAAWNVDVDTRTFQIVFLDLEPDGDPDLYLATDKGYGSGDTNRLFRNDGTSFTDISVESNAGVTMDGMGIGVGDFNGDAVLDLYITNTVPGNVLLLGDGATGFTDASADAGVQSFGIGWGADFFDVDDDGDLDLYVCDAGSGMNRMYLNQPDWPVPDVAPQWGIDSTASSYGLARGDVDGDGDLDFVVQESSEPLRLYINGLETGHRWIRLRVVGDAADPFGIGARLVGTSGARVHLREVAAGSNYKSQNEFVQHIGLADADSLETLKITWPHDRACRVITGLPADRTWTIVPPKQLGDLDVDGDRDLLDARALLDCAASPTFEPGCERADLTGDSRVDVADVDALLLVYDWPVADCDEDGVADLRQIVSDPQLDLDGDGRLDGCGLVPSDLDGDGAVDINDLLLVLGAWGDGTSPADLDGSGTVDVADLLTVLGAWTP